MRFTNGCWMMREGVECFSPKQAYEMIDQGQSIKLVAPTNKIKNKGDTLGLVNLTVFISAPYPEVIRVQTYHHMGIREKEPKFQISPVSKEKIKYELDEGILTVHSGTLSLVIDTVDWKMHYERNGRLLTKSNGRGLSFMKEDWKGMPYDTAGEGAYMHEQLGLSVDEKVYGFGEKFTSFIKNGQTVKMWNEDGGTCTDQSYKNIPFYMTNKGYGVFVNHPEKVEFEAATENVSGVSFSVKGESLGYFVINGPSMKEVLMHYTDITGKPALVPQWSFGLWLSTSFTTDYDEKTVMSFIDGMKERGIPLSVFHFDCCWMKEFHWTDFVWDSRIFPDPKGMLSRIKERGVKICVWINPYIGQESVLFKEGAEKGYLIKRANGDVWQWDMWQPGLALVDFTNPDACRWYQGKLKELLDTGVDCFKTDFGERIPTDCVYYDGSDPVKMHNYYTYLYNECVFDVLESVKGKNEAILFARSATAGTQKFPINWGGDCWSDYESMEQSLRGGLSLTSSGFGYWSHDIGGFENTSTPDVYKRWAAFGLFSSHSRLHGSSSYRVPWVYDDEAVDVVRFFTRTKLSLLPYLYSSAVNTSRTGIPIMRSMVIEFTDDEICSYLDKQYMLGDSILVSPIFNDEGMADYYLPAGRWTNIFTGEEDNGGHYRREHHSYMSIPAWVRENTILPTSTYTDDALYEFDDHMEYKVYGLCDKADAVVYQHADEIMELHGTKSADGIIFTQKAKKPYDIRLVNVKAVSVSGASMKIEGNDTLIHVDDVKAEIVCKV